MAQIADDRFGARPDGDGDYHAPVRHAVVYSSAGVALTLAALLTLFGVGDDPEKLANWQALVLGIVQGATELLPISSSGHLILVPWLFEWDYLEANDAFNQTFDVSLHLGTLVAVGAYFWHDLKGLVVAWLGTLRTSLDRDDRGADGVGRRRGDDPGGGDRLPARGLHRRASGGAVADRDLPGGVRPAPRLGRPAADDAVDGRPRR